MVWEEEEISMAPFPDDVKEVLADLTFSCATFKMGIPFAPDRLSLLARRSIDSSRRPCDGLRLDTVALNQDCALAHHDRAPCPGQNWAGHLLHQQA